MYGPEGDTEDGRGPNCRDVRGGVLVERREDEEWSVTERDFPLLVTTREETEKRENK